jgi:hypothetical protein
VCVFSRVLTSHRRTCFQVLEVFLSRKRVVIYWSFLLLWRVFCSISHPKHKQTHVLQNFLSLFWHENLKCPSSSITQRTHSLFAFERGLSTIGTHRSLLSNLFLYTFPFLFSFSVTKTKPRQHNNNRHSEPRGSRSRERDISVNNLSWSFFVIFLFSFVRQCSLFKKPNLFSFPCECLGLCRDNNPHISSSVLSLFLALETIQPSRSW